MNETEIRKYAQLMRELELTALEITQEEGKVRLERGVVASAGAVALPAADAAANVQQDAQKQNAISVRSPLVGVFYAAPAENAATYVSIGDTVCKGQVLCIIEAMKLMNEIVAEEDGTICEICVTNGQVVEYGTELFRIER